MSEVKVGGNWEHVDELEGEVLKDNERVIVTWPDQTLESLDVKVHSTSTTTSDQGSIDTRVPVRKAYVIVDHHGLDLEVRLLEFENVERVREGVCLAD